MLIFSAVQFKEIVPQNKRVIKLFRLMQRVSIKKCSKCLCGRDFTEALC